ncbi:MAG TPA: hypothetical protein VGE45_19790 [Chloroflexia bacterium]|jgi:hypothetical protein
MATKGSTIPERIARWKVMSAGLKPLLGEMPHLAAMHSELEKVTLQSEELDARSEALKAESREVNRTREELAKAGDDLRLRLAAALQNAYGFRSEKLLEFGVPPRRARGKDRKPRARPPAAPPPSPGVTPPPAGAGQPAATPPVTAQPVPTAEPERSS